MVNISETGTSMTKIPNSYKFNIQGIPPQIQTAGGTVAKANASSSSILSSSNMAFFSLILKLDAVREPH
jgi:hypothetical protein